MLNFRVRDLDAMLTQLRGKGAGVAEETQEMAGVDRFGWVTDPATASSCGSPPSALTTRADRCRSCCSESGQASALDTAMTSQNAGNATNR